MVERMRIVLVDPDRTQKARWAPLTATESLVAVPDTYKALGELERGADVLILAGQLPAAQPQAVLARVRARFPLVGVICLVADGDVVGAVSAAQAGAMAVLTDSLHPAEVAAALEVCRQRRMAAGMDGPDDSGHLLGRSDATRELRQLIDQVAPTRATALITGESGTGKELVARMLHERSNRASGPFVRLHCAALSETLLESELFGHERGAFTGAVGRRRGRFEDADGGTLFLDEIGEIAPAIQVKLLRFLQEREFERVGGNETVKVDVRVVTATNRNLRDEVRAGRFRKDLFYRLNVLHLETTPLRARRDDILVLAHHFVARFCQENGKPAMVISPEALALLVNAPWEGNVRELENVVERAVILGRDRIDTPHLPYELTEPAESMPIRIPGSSLADIERHAILRTLEAASGSTAKTAQVLQISVRKVRYKLVEYGLRRKQTD
jgi:two-component system, NtrC family, response regulator HydG